MANDASAERHRRALRALEKAIRSDTVAEFFDTNPLAKMLGEERDTLGISADSLSVDRELPAGSADEARGLEQIVHLYMNISSLDYRPRYRLSEVVRGTIAWHVIYTPDGLWRFDYLARARSVLEEILRVAHDWFEPVINVYSSKQRAENIEGTPLERSQAATKRVRAFWGIDRPNPLSNAASRFDDVWRWSSEVLKHPVSLRAARSWAQSYPDLGRWYPTRQTEPPEWPGESEQWPPKEILRFAVDRMEGDNDYPLDDYPPDVLERALRRRTLELFVGYLGDSPHTTPAYFFFDHRLAPAWLPGYVTDLRSAEEILKPRKVESGRWRWFGALTMLAFTRVCAEIGSKRMDKVVQAEVTTQWRPQIVGGDKSVSDALANAAASRFHSVKRDADSPDSRRELQTAIAKRLDVRQRSAAKARVGELPSFVRHFPEEIQGVYRSAQVANAMRERAAFNEYDKSRGSLAERLSVHDENARRVVQFGDFLVHLAATQAPVESRPSPRQRRRFRDYLEQSGGEKSVYHFIADRNEALTLQKRDFHEALRTADRGHRVLTATQGQSDWREYLEMKEQFNLNLAGSWVQWLENQLALPAERLASVDPSHLEFLAHRCLRHSSAAVSALDELVAGENDRLKLGKRQIPLFANPRFTDGYVSEGTWAYRALEIHYRCLCAAATVAVSFNPASLAMVDFEGELHETYRRIVDLATPIPPDALPRFVQTTLWHSFLTGMSLPAIPEMPPNRSIKELRFLTRELDTVEANHPGATMMTEPRVNLATDWLISQGWNMGAVGTISRESRVGRRLHTLSHENFGGWRTYWDYHLRRIDEGVRAAAGRFEALKR